MPRKSIHKEKMDGKKIWLIIFLSFLMGVISSSLMYITSDYIREATRLEGVGVFYVVAYLCIFLMLLYFHRVVKKFGKIRIFLYIQLLKICLLSLLSIVPVGYPGAMLVTAYMIFSYMTWVELDAILETFSIDRMSGRIRGAYLLISNVGYMIGPLVSTQLLSRFGFTSVFMFTMSISMLLFMATLIQLRSVREEIREILSPKDLIKKAIKHKDVFNIYLVSIALEIFFALAIVYIPLHLLSLGFDWSQVGILLVFAMVPYVFLQYPAGLLADKKLGEKEIIIAAIALTSSSTIMIGFTDSKSLFFWGAFMIFCRIGPSVLEIMRDSYFYKKVDGRDLDLIDFFRTAGPVGIVFGTIISSLTLFVFPMKTIFLLSGVIMFLGMIPALRLSDNISEEEARIGKGEIRFRNRLGFFRSLGVRLKMIKVRGVDR